MKIPKIHVQTQKLQQLKPQTIITKHAKGAEHIYHRIWGTLGHQTMMTYSYTLFPLFVATLKQRPRSLLCMDRKLQCCYHYQCISLPLTKGHLSNVVTISWQIRWPYYRGITVHCIFNTVVRCEGRTVMVRVMTFVQETQADIGIFSCSLSSTIQNCTKMEKSWQLTHPGLKKLDNNLTGCTLQITEILTPGQFHNSGDVDLI